jgi:hypothetical protein
MVMVMVVVVVMTVIMVVIVVMIMLVAMLMIPSTRPLHLTGPRQLLFPTTLGHGSVRIPRLVFSRPDEVNRPIARVVLVAMQSPRVRVFGRNMQVQGLYNDVRRPPLYNNRLGVDHRRRVVLTQVHATVNARDNFAPDSDSEIHVTGLRNLTQHTGRQGQKERPSQHFSHSALSTARDRAVSLIEGSPGPESSHGNDS